MVVRTQKVTMVQVAQVFAKYYCGSGYQVIAEHMRSILLIGYIAAKQLQQPASIRCRSLHVWGCAANVYLFDRGLRHDSDYT